MFFSATISAQSVVKQFQGLILWRQLKSCKDFKPNLAADKNTNFLI